MCAHQSGARSTVAVLASAGILVVALIGLHGDTASTARSRLFRTWSVAGENEYLSFVMCSPDDRMVAVWVARPIEIYKPPHIGRIVLIDTVTNTVRELEDERYFSGLCLSPDGDKLYFVAMLSLWEYDIGSRRTRQVVPQLVEGAVIPTWAMATSASGKTVTFADATNATDQREWDIATGQLIERPEEVAEWIGQAISPDGKLFATGGWPGWSPRIVERGRREPLTYCLRSGFIGPNCIAFTPNSRALACVYDDGVLSLFDLAGPTEGGAPIVFETPGFEDVFDMCFSHDGKFVFCVMRDGRVEERRCPFDIGKLW
jgi:WD40 repeat protein